MQFRTLSPVQTAEEVTVSFFHCGLPGVMASCLMKLPFCSFIALFVFGGQAVNSFLIYGSLVHRK